MGGCPYFYPHPSPPRTRRGSGVAWFPLFTGGTCRRGLLLRPCLRLLLPARLRLLLLPTCLGLLLPACLRLLLPARLRLLLLPACLRLLLPARLRLLLPACLRLLPRPLHQTLIVPLRNLAVG